MWCILVKIKKWVGKLFKKNKLRHAIILAMATTVAGAHGEGRVIEEVVVTATKREQPLQDVPIAVTALTEENLQQVGAANFSDYALQLPGVTAGGSGPGQNTIYIRGIASTTPNLTTAGVAGLAPNVAFYLDEQPLAQPGRNLDVYVADMERIEVLSGPQGTLFGASSQAGNVRLITNKPDFTETYGSLQIGAGLISNGSETDKIEVMYNLSLGDNLALRGVLYSDSRGGWIDNVSGTVDASESARFRQKDTVRANGVPVSAQRAGTQADADLSGVTFLTASSQAKKDINETSYEGARVSAYWNISDDWQLLLSHQVQDVEADGVFFADPSLGDLEVQRFTSDVIEDQFNNTAWTLNGRIADLEAVYTGAYTDRETSQNVDYTDYLFVGDYLPYYICDAAVTYPGDSDPAGTCNQPNLSVISQTSFKSTTHEFRVSSEPTESVRVTAGIFTQDSDLRELNNFYYPGSIQAIGYDGSKGWPANYPLTNTSVTGEIGKASPGYYSDAGPFPAGVIFRNDIKRTEEQTGIFGELTYDYTDKLSLTVGARYYDITVDFEGSANSSFGNFGQSADTQSSGTNISSQFSPGNAVGAPDSADTSGTIFKVTQSYRPNEQQMYYATWSEGFRPGLLNRPGGSQKGDFKVPYALDTDEVTNIELGLKSDYLDGRLRLNAALFRADIENLQTTIFDTSIVNLFFSDNAANATINGFEADFIWLPESIDGLTVTGAMSRLNTEITEVITPTDDVQRLDQLAFAPEFQGNLRARYEWSLNSGVTAFVMPSVIWSSEAFSDVIRINRIGMDSYIMTNISAGLLSELWSAEVYVSNLSDKRAQVSNNFVFDVERVTYAQPRTIGMRLKYNF